MEWMSSLDVFYVRTCLCVVCGWSSEKSRVNAQCSVYLTSQLTDNQLVESRVYYIYLHPPVCVCVCVCCGWPAGRVHAALSTLNWCLGRRLNVPTTILGRRGLPSSVSTTVTPRSNLSLDVTRVSTMLWARYICSGQSSQCTINNGGMYL